MSMENLPPEILEKILMQLDVGELITFTVVCPEWYEKMETLSDSFWMKIIARDHTDVYKLAYRKSNLSWFELFRSLTLWKQVPTANVTVNKLLSGHTDSFLILSDGVIACLQKSKSKDRQHFSSKIIYYNLDTFKEIDKKCYDFILKSYQENDKFFVIIYCNDTHMVVDIHVKPYDKHFIFEEDTPTSSILLENEVYYQTKEKLCHVILDDTAEDIIVKTFPNVFKVDDKQVALGSLVAAVEVNNEQTNILTSTGYPLSVTNDKLELLINHPFCVCTDNKTKVTPLGRFGFQWQDKNVFSYISERYLWKLYLLCSAIHIHGKIVVVGMKYQKSAVDVYYNPFWNGEFQLDCEKPIKSIDLTRKLRFKHKKDCVDHITQIDVIEMDNGHRIIVLACGRVCVIELTHTDLCIYNTITKRENLMLHRHAVSKKLKLSKHSHFNVSFFNNV